MHPIAVANAVSVWLSSNNVVLVQTSTQMVIARRGFGNKPDTRLLVDLVTSLHTHDLQTSAQ